MFPKFIFAALFILFFQPLLAQRLSRDYRVDIVVNQAGYLPQASKLCQTQGAKERSYKVVDIQTQQVVFSGLMKPVQGDFGAWSTGDFSTVTREGFYYIQADTLRSYPFQIGKSVYEKPMALIVEYFSRQRCGGSATGYLSPCHLDDGVRMDNGKHQNVTGGWHDASDLRKWVGATIYGMVGMGKIFSRNKIQQKEILEELKWGNQYFLNMQEPQGYVMSYIGGDVQKHSDSNRWTDNETGEEGGALQMVKPNAGNSKNDMLIVGKKDDRVIRTDPLDRMGQFNFITSEALMAGITKNIDPPYSAKCLAAAIHCFDWCLKVEDLSNPGIISASIQAAIELFKTTGQEKYLIFAAKKAGDLKKLQVTKEGDPTGFYYHSLKEKEPYKNIWNGCLELIAICDLININPTHKDVPAWKEMVKRYAQDYLSPLAGKNSFGIVPFGLFSKIDPGGNRKIGAYWYRYFMQPEESWWVGINANLASTGIGLLKASQVLGDPHLKVLAQRQLDWILGTNPFNSSTLVGIGYQHPKHFPGSSFLPRTPVIPGAVLNGLGGDHNDQPSIGNGDWQISEYWTPMVAYTLWLMGELREGNP